MKKIILGSGSPRRKELLKLITEDFDVRVSDAEEKTDPSLSPAETVRTLAVIKAEGIISGNADEIIITADTVVAVDGKILGKPVDHNDAFRMLASLSGRKHCVYTGVCITDGNKKTVFSVCSDVYFYELSEKDIYDYIATGECDDKAGAYGIQGKGSLLVEKIHGDYFNIVGLPVSRLAKELKNFTL